MPPKKPIGGAEKLRIKSKKLLEKSGQSCKKLDEMFKNKNPVDSAVDLSTCVVESAACVQEEHNDSVTIKSSLRIESHHESLPVSSAVTDGPIIELDENQNRSQNEKILELFLQFHPKQKSRDPVLQKAFHRKDGTQRAWLTLDEHENKLFCWLCLAFSKQVNSNNRFCVGFTDRKHVHERADEHESSDNHKTCVDAYILRKNDSNVSQLLFTNKNSLRNLQVAKNRQIIERVIDVIKLIGKRGLSWRAKRNEAAHSLADLELDHGNFLEILLLLAKYDSILQDHINECVARTKAKQVTKSSSNTFSGGFVTLISKTTADRVIECIATLIQIKEVQEMKDAGIYSIQLDTSPDISGLDQCSVIGRYVTPQKILERLLCVLNCLDILKASNMVKTTLNRLKSIRNDFELVKAKAEEFIKLINDRLEAQNVNSHVETELPVKRKVRRTLLPGETTNDIVSTDPNDLFRINFQVVRLIPKTADDMAYTAHSFHNHNKTEDIPTLHQNEPALSCRKSSSRLRPRVIRKFEKPPAIKIPQKKDDTKATVYDHSMNQESKSLDDSFVEKVLCGIQSCSTGLNEGHTSDSSTLLNNTLKETNDNLPIQEKVHMASRKFHRLFTKVKENEAPPQAPNQQAHLADMAKETNTQLQQTNNPELRSESWRLSKDIWPRKQTLLENQKQSLLENQQIHSVQPVIDTTLNNTMELSSKNSVEKRVDYESDMKKCHYPPENDAGLQKDRDEDLSKSSGVQNTLQERSKSGLQPIQEQDTLRISSNHHKVSLINLNFDSAGQYKCEVSTNGPQYATNFVRANLSIIQLPKQGPEITGLSSFYAVGENVTANCSALPSVPQARLQWFINGKS
ncbi:hypothetical protein QAD02_006581, partial [Eretmocerus hayati]